MSSILETVTKSAKNVVKDWLTHHPHDNVVQVGGVDLIIQEVALDTFAHRLKLTITASPDNLLDGTSVTAKGHHARDARAKCMKILAAKVALTYKKEEKKSEEKKS